MKFLIMCLLLANISMAAELKGVKLPDDETVAGKKLVLNGLGLREKEVMHIDIKVYVGGLYLEKKASKEDEILSSKGLKRMKLKFVRKVRGSDMRNAWKENLDDNCGDICKKIREKSESFLSLMPDVKDEDVMDYTFTAKGVELAHNDKTLGAVDDPEFARVVLASWLGKKPIGEDLKSGLLGR